jgi:hypothetical protein
MPGKAVISLTTGLEDPEKVTVAFLVAVGAAESGRPTLMFLANEADHPAMSRSRVMPSGLGGRAEQLGGPGAEEDRPLAVERGFALVG